MIDLSALTMHADYPLDDRRPPVSLLSLVSSSAFLSSFPGDRSTNCNCAKERCEERKE